MSRGFFGTSNTAKAAASTTTATKAGTTTATTALTTAAAAYAVCLALLLALQILPQPAHAKDQTRETVREYKNICKDCGIEKVFVHVRDVSQDYEKHGMHSTMLYAGFEAKTWEDAQKYGFVQYIRGCTFESHQDKAGRISRRVGEAISHLGERRTFVFPEWSFDANTTDPIYYGGPKLDLDLPGGRLAHYLWTEKRGNFRNDQSTPLYEVMELPPDERAKMKPRLFVVDMPSSAQYRNSGKAFTNVALEFRMCLHRIEDIPAKVTKDTKLPEPLHCFEWDSHQEYDFQKKQYVRSTGKGMHPFCASQTPMNPAKAWQKENQEPKRVTIDLDTLDIVPTQPSAAEGESQPQQAAPGH